MAGDGSHPSAVSLGGFTCEGHFSSSLGSTGVGTATLKSRQRPLQRDERRNFFLACLCYKEPLFLTLG